SALRSRTRGCMRRRELFEQTISANFVSTPEHGLIQCNQAFAELLGFDSPEHVLQTESLSIYAHQEDRERFLTELRTHRRLVGYEVEFRRRDGRIVPVLENAVGTFKERGDLVKITGF